MLTTAVFIARNAWLRAARGEAIDNFTIVFDALPDPRAADDAWFAPLANLFIRSGSLKNTKLPIATWSSADLTVTLAMPIDPAAVPPHTQMEIHRGCDLTHEVCFTVFNNIINRRGEEFVPPNLTTALS